MKKTAKQPTGALATNPNPTPKRTALDKVILGVVIVIALVVIALSFSNTKLLARELGLNEYLTAGLVEILFASLLFIRGRQRATQRNVPFFLTAGYFVSLGFVTGVNMWGLAIENPTIGPIVGIAISGSMWLMESTLVWLWTASHQPHKKSAKELEREAKREIEEIKIMQKIAWMRWEAQKPSLDLIRKARKEEERRKETVEGGMPEFFILTSATATQPVGSTNQPIEMADSQSTIQPVPNQSNKTASQDYQPAILAGQPLANHQPFNQESANQPANYESANQPNKSASELQPANHSAIKATTKLTTSHTDQPTNQLEVIESTSSQQSNSVNQESTTKPAKEDQPSTSTTKKRPTVKKKPASRVAKSTIQPTAKLVELAVTYKEENNDWPSERKLAEIGGTSRHQAGKVLDTLDPSRKNYQPPSQQSAKASG